MANSDTAVGPLVSDETEKEESNTDLNVQEKKLDVSSPVDKNVTDLDISLSVKTEAVDDNVDESKTLAVTTNNDGESKEQESTTHDPYSYTKLNDFTSEIYKIEINNLPNYVGYGVSNFCALSCPFLVKWLLNNDFPKDKMTIGSRLGNCFFVLCFSNTSHTAS